MLAATLIYSALDSRGLAWISAVSYHLAQKLDEHRAGAQYMVLVSRIMVPKDVHIWIPRTCEYYLTWQRGIKVCRMGLRLLVSNLKLFWINQLGPMKSQGTLKDLEEDVIIEKKMTAWEKLSLTFASFEEWRSHSQGTWEASRCWERKGKERNTSLDHSERNAFCQNFDFSSVRQICEGQLNYKDA